MNRRTILGAELRPTRGGGYKLFVKESFLERWLPVILVSAGVGAVVANFCVLWRTY
jgi:hypothetical protein